MRDHSTATVDVDAVHAEIARARLKIHEFAAIVRIHPGYLGQMLNRRRPISPEVAERIQAAMKTLGPAKP
jgi:DNA-binding transcriptional regulator YdaS (Cro superfamily)